MGVLRIIIRPSAATAVTLRHRPGRLRRMWLRVAISTTLILSWAAPPLATAMNDTDAVTGPGLFPIFPSGVRSKLVLKAETLTVILTGTGVSERRSYVVLNDGPARTIELGTVLRLDVATADSSSGGIRVTLDGAEVPVRSHVGLLLNRAGRVAVTSPDPRALRDCIENNDGAVCSQNYVTFTVPFASAQMRRVSFEFTTRCGPRAAIELALARLYFYSEQFWEGSIVSDLKADLDVGALGVPARDFIPAGQYVRFSTPPTAIGAKALTWRMRQFRQKEYYGRGLVHPFAVNQERVLDKYLRGVGSSLADTTAGRILRADSVLAMRSSAPGTAPPPAASIVFDVLRPGPVRLEVWNGKGEVVRRLNTGSEAGTRTVAWDGLDYLRRPVAPGTYRFRLEVSGCWVGDRGIRVLR